MPKKTLNIGIVGYGFMGRAHSNAYRQVNRFFDCEYQPVLKVACGRNKERVEAFAKNWGYEETTQDWRELIERSDIDAIDIAAPNHMHKEIAIAAAEAGKMILCEKPLGRNLQESREIAAAAEKAGVKTLVWYNYRFVPAVTMAKQLVDEGKLGRIYHYRANFLQDWTISEDLPQGGEALWRLDVEASGSGVTGDLLAHCIDTAMWLNGSITSVSAMTETFVKERVHNETGEKQAVGIDDACAFLARFENGSMAIFESTRYARGHKAKYSFEMNGRDASLAWDLHDLHRLEYFDNADGDLKGWRSVHVSEGEHPYMDKWWVPGLSIGYEHSFTHCIYGFLKSLEDGQPAFHPDFSDGVKTDAICQAVLESAKSQQWVELQNL
jgi:predicted dehydrogenase